MKSKFSFIITTILIIVFIGIAGCTHQEKEISDGLYAGTSEVEITPPLGYPVHGVPNAGWLDHVKVKTLVLNQGKEWAAIIMADLFFIDLDLSTEVRNLASEASKIPFANICIAATHTHADPSYYRECEVYFERKKEGLLTDDDKSGYIGQLITKMVETVITAMNSMKPVSVKSGNAITEGIVYNRRYLMKDGSVVMNPGFLNPDIVRVVGPVDPELGILLLHSKKNENPITAFISFPMQVATIGETNMFSAGYPYFIERGLQQKFGNEFISIFAEGHSADVNHWDVTKSGPQIGYEPATKPIGHALANYLISNIGNLSKSDENLAVRNRIIQVPLQMYSNMDLEWADNYHGTPPGLLINARVKRILHLEKLRARFGDTIPMEVQVFRINDETAIVALPGQLFVELGLAIKAASPFSTTLIVTLANSHEECIPLRKAYTEGSYEIVYSRVEAGGGEMLVETALDILNELWLLRNN